MKKWIFLALLAATEIAFLIFGQIQPAPKQRISFLIDDPSRAVCTDSIKAHCNGVPFENGRAARCLLEHGNSLSEPCLRVAFPEVAVTLPKSPVRKLDGDALSFYRSWRAGDFVNRFTRTLTFAGPKKRLNAVRAIVYGNSEFGYFEQTELGKSQSNVSLTFSPPGYGKPIDFFFSEEDASGKIRYNKVGRQTFVSPIPSWFKQTEFRLEGQFSARFFLVAYHTRDPLGQIVGPFPAIINRSGQIVWLHFVGVSRPKACIQFDKLNPGRYAILRDGRDSYFELVRANGEVLNHVSMPTKAVPWLGDHAFVLEPDERSFLMASFYCKLSRKDWLRNWSSKTWKKRWQDFWRSVFRPRTYADPVILRVHLDSGKSEVVWTGSDFFSPSTQLDRFVSPDGLEDPTLGPISNEQYLALLEHPKVMSRKWGDWRSDCDTDWAHPNAIVRSPDGSYLVSARSWGKVLQLSEDFRKILWTIGSDRSDTYQFADSDEAFSAQHDPTWTSRHNLLVFDNHSEFLGLKGKRKQSRVTEYAIESESKKMRVVWSFQPQPPIFSEVRGSARELRNGNIFGFFPDNVSQHQQFFEIDYQTRTAVGRGHYKGLSNGGMFRLVPIYELGTERAVESPVRMRSFP